MLTWAKTSTELTRCTCGPVNKEQNGVTGELIMDAIDFDLNLSWENPSIFLGEVV